MSLATRGCVRNHACSVQCTSMCIDKQCVETGHCLVDGGSVYKEGDIVEISSKISLFCLVVLFVGRWGT